MKKFFSLLVLMLLPLVANAAVKIDGFLYDLDANTKTAKLTSGKNRTGETVIPSTVTYKDVVYSVTTIGTNAFSGCSTLTSIAIPASVTSIENSAFEGCNGLTSVQISDLEAWCKIEFGNSKANPLYYAHHLYMDGEEIENIVIPDGVKKIRDYAFYGCDGLTEVIIGNSVTYISSSAFVDCTNLAYVSIPNSITNIDYYTFAYCENLTKVELNCNAIVSKDCEYGESVINRIFGNYVKEYILGEDITSIGSNAFQESNWGYSHLTSVTIGNNVTSIGHGAFWGCNELNSVHISDLEAWYNIQHNNSFSNRYHLYLNGEEVKDVVIPNGMKAIGDYTFEACAGLTSVTIPNSVTKIGKNAFHGCTELSSITIPDNIEEIGGDAFTGTPWLESQPDGIVYLGLLIYTYKGTMEPNTHLIIKDGTKSICAAAFANCSGLSSITIPNSVTSIGYEAFRGCSGLSSIIIPNSVTSIESATFYQCSGLTSVTIPNSVTSIGVATFAGCSGLTSVTIPVGITYIKAWAFSGCSGLTSISIPNSVTVIDINAFEGCSGLTEVIIGNSMTFVGDAAFKGCNLKNVYCYTELVPETKGNEEGPFYDSNENATLHVPASSVEAYSSALGWKDFENIVALTDSDPKPTGITSVNNNMVKSERYYSLDGKPLAAPQRGINIVKMSDGTTKKVVVK